MPEIKIKIKSCQDCPFFTSETQYTADSFERPEKWICKKKSNKVIRNYVDWNDKVPVPDWCPVLVKPELKK